MALHLLKTEAPVKTLKVCLIETVENPPCVWTPTGRKIYVDRAAPLSCLPGWDKGCERGQMAVRKSLFDQIAKIIREAQAELDARNDDADDADCA